MRIFRARFSVIFEINEGYPIERGHPMTSNVWGGGSDVV